MNLVPALLVAGSAMICMTAANAAKTPAPLPDAGEAPIQALKDTITQRHPVDYFILATRLFQMGEKDEAIFWFYAGQLRFRARLACHPELPQSGEPALYTAMAATTGQVMNEYIGGYPSRWIATIRRAIAWDEANPNGVDPKEGCAAAIAQQHEGARQLIDWIEQNRQQIREQRAANGLPNFE